MHPDFTFLIRPKVFLSKCKNMKTFRYDRVIIMVFTGSMITNKTREGNSENTVMFSEWFSKRAHHQTYFNCFMKMTALLKVINITNNFIQIC